MQRPPEIRLNQFQLAILLDNDQKSFLNYVTAENVFCPQCGGTAIQGIVIDEVYLTDLNDVLVVGNCKKCNGEVARLFEFGEDKAFYAKANKFRKSIGE
jgi:hypothetical protein